MLTNEPCFPLFLQLVRRVVSDCYRVTWAWPLSKCSAETEHLILSELMDQSGVSQHQPDLRAKIRLEQLQTSPLSSD